jgi:hypothetical protein
MLQLQADQKLCLTTIDNQSYQNQQHLESFKTPIPMAGYDGDVMLG